MADSHQSDSLKNLVIFIITFAILGSVIAAVLFFNVDLVIQQAVHTSIDGSKGSDSAETWKPVVNGSAYSGAWAGISCYEDGLCLAGFRSDTTPGGARIRRSSDSGATWSEDLSITGAESARAYYFARNCQTVLASGGAANAGEGSVPNIFRSTDNGVTWSTAANAGMLRNLTGASNATGVYTILHLGNGRFIAGLEGLPLIIGSDDNGVTWTVLQTLTGISIRRLNDMGDYILLAAAYNSGIWRSFDSGRTWRKVADSPSNVFSIHDAGEGVWLAGTAGRVGRSINVSKAYRQNGVVYLTTVSEHGLGMGDRVGVYGFKNESMEVRPFVEITVLDRFHFSYKGSGPDMESIPLGNAVVKTAGDQVIYRSTDRGETWSCAANLTAWSDLTYIRTFVSTPDGRVYAFVAANEYSQKDRGLTTWLSEDRGITWRLVANPYIGPYGPLNAVYDAATAADGTKILGTQPDSVILKGHFP